MRFRIDDLVLDASALLITRNGEAVPTSRRVFALITFLIERRERAVSRDELIRHLWRREDVSFNQLAQVVLAARQLLGDDGTSQRFVRTIPGFGYHWVAPVVELPACEPGFIHSTSASAPASDDAQTSGRSHDTAPTPSKIAFTGRPSDHSQTLRAISSSSLRLGLLLAGMILLGLGVLGSSVLEHAIVEQESESAAEEVPVREEDLDSLPALRSNLRLGHYERVREGLARLPLAVAESRDAQLLAIDLDILRGRWRSAEEGLNASSLRALEFSDNSWQAELLSRRSVLSVRARGAYEEAVNLADAAVKMLELPTRDGLLAKEHMAAALQARGRAYLASSKLEEAALDLGRARDLFIEAGHELRAADVSASLARVWMRRGRLNDALDQLNRISEIYRLHDDPVGLISSSNTALRIQAEMLRWEDALVSSNVSIEQLRKVPESERRHRTRQLRMWALIGLGRLREAASLKSDLEASAAGGDELIFASFHLESGSFAKALEYSEQAFLRQGKLDPYNVLLENREGALLVWMVAARELRSKGSLTRSLSDPMRAALKNPESSTGRIALGHWLWLTGKLAESEEELNEAFRQARSMGQLLRMRLAADALIRMHLETGSIEAASTVLAKLRAHSPEWIEKDFASNVLSARVALAQGRVSAGALHCERAFLLAAERTLPAALAAGCRDAIYAAGR